MKKQRRAPAERPGEILEAALALFVEKGFAATRLDDVAARAGLSKAAIYLYFEDKMALFQGVVRQAIGSNLLTVEALAKAHQGPVADADPGASSISWRAASRTRRWPRSPRW